MKRVAVALALAALLAVYAGAASIPVDLSVYGSSSCDTATGLEGHGTWADGNEGFKIRWEITGDGPYTYKYWLSAKDGTRPIPGGALSHWILEVSEFITPANVGELIYDEDPLPILTGDPKQYTSTSDGASNPDMPGLGVYGVKFNADTEYYSFVSTQQPVWGDMYAKDGKQGGPPGAGPKPWNTVWNENFGMDPTDATTNFTGWIPTPDTKGGGPEEEIIPEPGTICLLGMGLIGMLGLRKRRR